MNKLKILLFGLLLLTTATHLQAQKQWTYMVYLFGSDLEGGFEKYGEYSNAGTNDIAEMVRAGSTNNVNVIVTTGGADKDGWREIKRWKIENGEQIPIEFNAPNNRMGDPRNLTEFINWATSNYPAENYVLDLWNHGSDIQGYGGDEIPGNNHEVFKIPQLKRAIQNSNFINQGNRFEVLGFDACLMANLEVHNAMKTFANYIVSSEQLEPGHGWDYTPIVRAMENGSASDGISLGRIIADGFLAQARAQQQNQVTLSVVDASQIDNVISAVEGLMNAVGNSGTADLQEARSRSEDYASTSSGNEAGDNHDVVDIGHLAENLKRVNDNYSNAADAVNSALRDAVKYKVQDREQPNATGLSLFVPHKLIGVPQDLQRVFNDFYNDLNFSNPIKNFVANYADRARGNNNEAPDGEEVDPNGEYDDWEEGELRTVPIAKSRNDDAKQVARAILNDPKDLESIRVLLIESNSLDDPNDFITLGAVLPDRLRYSNSGRLLIEYDWDQEWLGIGGTPVNIQNIKQIGLGNRRFDSPFGNGASTTGQLSTRGGDVSMVLTIPAVINPDEAFIGRDVYLNYSLNAEGGYDLISIIPQREDGEPNQGQKERISLVSGDRVMILYDGFNEVTDEIFDAVEPDAVFTIQTGNSDLKLEPMLLDLNTEYRIAFEMIDFAQQNTIIYDPRTFVTSEIMLGNIVANGNQTDMTVCTGDGQSDIISFGLQDCNMDNISYVITTDQDIILGPFSGKMEFEGAPVYNFRVYAVAYYGDLTVNYGDNIHNAALASSDFTLSPNYVAISVTDNCGNLRSELDKNSKVQLEVNSYKYIGAANQLSSTNSAKAVPLTDLLKGKKVELRPNSTKAFPNPATNYINIELADYVGKSVTISIINQLGQTMKTLDIEEVEHRPITLDLESFNTGMYMMRVDMNGLLMDSHKFIIK